MSARDDLLNEIERFLERWDMSPTKFGQLCMNDHTFVKRLRRGSDVRLGTAERVRTFLKTWRPPPRGNARRPPSEAVAAV